MGGFNLQDIKGHKMTLTNSIMPTVPSIFKKVALTALITLVSTNMVGCQENNTHLQQSTPITSNSQLTFTPINTYLHGGFDESAAEITDYHPATKQAFIVNAQNKKVDVLSYHNPTNPKLVTSLDVSDLGDSVNSVAVHGNLVALAVQAKNKTDNGYVVIYDAINFVKLAIVPAGALPDMVTFTPNGKYIIVANEGEPTDYKIDPEGSVSIIDVSNAAKPTAKRLRFTGFNNQKQALIKSGVRIFGKLADGTSSTVAQDLEPEYVAVSGDSKTAYVSLQENNAIAVVDIENAKITRILPLGYKDHSKAGNELDPSNKDKKINIANFPVMGMYQPDSIASYEVNGKTYIITANEGDGREWGDFSDETKVGKLKLDSAKFPASACGGVECTDKTALGKLKVTNSMGDTDGDGDYDVLYAYGARSFSIWNPDNMAKPVYDSGSELARITAKKYPNNFNASNDDNSLDDRSDNKGIEPEGVTVGKIGNRSIAFIGLERISSVVAYDVTNPSQAKFLGEVNNRNFDDAKLKAAQKGTAKANAAGDLGPEGLHFIAADDSPTGKPMLLVGYEVSGTSRLYELNLTQ